MRRECLNRNHWTSVLKAPVVIGDYKHEHNQRHRHSALGYLTPADYTCPAQAHPSPDGLRNQLTLVIENNLALQPGGATIGGPPSMEGYFPRTNTALK